MNDEQANECQRLRDEVQQLEQRLAALGRRLEQLGQIAPEPPPAPSDLPPVIEPPPPAEIPPVIPPPPAPPPSIPPPVLVVPAGSHALTRAATGAREPFELRLGTVWLPRVGLALLLAGMALYFGYYASNIHGGTALLLTANAVLAVVVVFGLPSRLQATAWMALSYAALFAVYLVDAIWLLRFHRGAEASRLVFEQGYLDSRAFWVRAAFLTLYWLIFMAGAILAGRRNRGTGETPVLPGREADPLLPERRGLLTLNNLFCFVLLTLLMRQAHPGCQSSVQLGLGGVLLVAAVFAWRRRAPERGLMQSLAVQGVAVASLGLLTGFTGARLFVALAVDSVILMALARVLGSTGVAWLGRVVFAIAASGVLKVLPDADPPILWSAAVAGLAGLAGARLEKRAAGKTTSAGAWFFALVAALLWANALPARFDESAQPWVWVGCAVGLGVLGRLLRTREISGAALLPLAWALLNFYSVEHRAEWRLAPSLALMVVTFGFGLARWRRARTAGGPEARVAATRALRPYAIFGLLVALAVTWRFCPETWMLTIFAAEAFGLVVIGGLIGEELFGWLAAVATVAGLVQWLGLDHGQLGPARLAATNLGSGLLLLVATERLLKARGAALGFLEKTLQELRSLLVLLIAALAVFGLRALVGAAGLTAAWAMGGLVGLVFGFVVRERRYRFAGLALLACSLGRVVSCDWAGLGTLARIASITGLGVVLLLIAFVYARHRERLKR